MPKKSEINEAVTKAASVLIEQTIQAGGDFQIAHQFDSDGVLWKVTAEKGPGVGSALDTGASLVAMRNLIMRFSAGDPPTLGMVSAVLKVAQHQIDEIGGEEVIQDYYSAKPKTAPTGIGLPN